MKWSAWLEEWGLKGLKINAGFLAMDFAPDDADRNAAWEMYTELLTRIATQPLPDQDGVEQTALDSVHALFDITRQIIKRHGWKCIEFTKIAVVVLNQVIRPFTARWHPRAQKGAFADPKQCAKFRKELRELQGQLKRYNKALANMAGVEDLTELEQVG